MTQSYHSGDVFRPFYEIARFGPKNCYEVSEVTGFGSVRKIESGQFLTALVPYL